MTTGIKKNWSLWNMSFHENQICFRLLLFQVREIRENVKCPFIRKMHFSEISSKKWQNKFNLKFSSTFFGIVQKKLRFKKCFQIFSFFILHWLFLLPTLFEKLLRKFEIINFVILHYIFKLHRVLDQ